MIVLLGKAATKSLGIVTAPKNTSDQPLNRDRRQFEAFPSRLLPVFFFIVHVTHSSESSNVPSRIHKTMAYIATASMSSLCILEAIGTHTSIQFGGSKSFLQPPKRLRLLENALGPSYRFERPPVTNTSEVASPTSLGWYRQEVDRGAFEA